MPRRAWTASQPACSIAHWCARSLRAWNRPSRSTEPKWRSHSARYSSSAVLAHVPRVARAGGALGRQREHVRGRHVGDAARADQPADVVEHRVRVLHVLDRLQEHDAVDVAGPQLDHVALEAHALARVLQARVLERVRVGVDADHGSGRARQHGRAVALAAREVDHAAAVRARRDPLVDHEVAPEPVVLLGDVRQRALAGERERRHALRLVALDVELRHRRAQSTTASRRPAVPRL